MAIMKNKKHSLKKGTKSNSSRNFSRGGTRL